MTRKRRAIAVTAILGASLAAPASSHALVTIGSSLTNGGPNIAAGCVVSLCTRAQVTLPADRTASNGVTSPVNGTVVTWRVRTDAGDTQLPITFRVISPASGGQFTGGGSAVTTTPPQITGVTPFATSVPIKIGDSIGLTHGNGNYWYYRIGGGVGAARLFNNAMALGHTQSATADSGDEILINADVEPSNDFTLGKPKPRNGGKVKIRATLPNAGTLTAGPKKGGKSASAAAVLKTTKRTVGAPGDLTFKVKPTKATQNQLARGGTKKVKIKVTFTPTNGLPKTRTIKAKLKG
jgi:hypothetical protein